MIQRFAKKLSFFIASIILANGLTVYAQTSSSSSYRVTESAFGSGGDVNVGSASYGARGSAGALGVGESTSTNYAAFAGPINPSDEYLEMVVSNTTVNLGNLSNSSTSFGAGTFYVRTYLNGGYTVQTISDPPTNESGFSLAAKSVLGAPIIGTEEFGINLVANTSPSVGANPYKQPDNTTNYATGIAATGYNTANNFKYVKNDIIAQSGTGRAWGQTDFTISYVVNISGITRAGVYTLNHTLVVITTF
jgi:hypothetical protein